MSVIHAPEETPLDARQLVWPVILLLFAGIFFSRLWYLQIVSVDELTDRAQRTNSIQDLTMAPRGQIVDRQGRVIASVKPNLVVMVRPKLALKNPEAIEKAAQILGVDSAALHETIRKASQERGISAPIYSNATVHQAADISEEGDLLPGFSVETQATRFYNDPTSLCHLLGYVGVPTDALMKELKAKGIDPAPYVGRDGLERQYEGELMGTAGKQTLVVDIKGRPLRLESTENPTPGRRLILGIDLEVQKLALQLLSGKRGSAVAVDPQTGEVIALASTPGFNLAAFQNRISSEEYAALTSDPDLPLRKRAIASAYPPGSTFKLVTTIAAMESGKFDPRESHYCDGALKIGNRKVKCENHAPGSMDFRQALTKSCNTYFGTLAKEIGITALRKAFDDLKLGEKTGIDLPGESGGIVPTAAWTAKHKKNGWYQGDTVNVGIGQGEVAVTPLQMANIAALVGNSGVNYVPHVVRAIQSPGDKGAVTTVERKVFAQIKGTPEFWQTLRSAMLNVMQNGTGKGAQISGLEWAGKTGSAEHKTGEKTHSWFVGFAPYDNPRIAICVMVESGGHGGEVSAPIAAKLVKAYLDSLNADKNSAERVLASRASTDLPRPE